jgi:hypothetical protein
VNRNENIDIAIRRAMSDLKDFQRETVAYVFAQLFEKGRSKMLVADEVGLGKTIVARGLIAKSFKKHIEATPNQEFHVIYICSNQALAAQNLKKLNLFKDEIKSIGRLIYLAYEPEAVKHNFRLSSLTPGTSFYLTGGSGQAEERLVLFTLLTRYKYFQNHQNGLRFLLIGGVRDPEDWKERTDDFQSNKRDLFRKNIFKKFKKKLQEKRLKQSDQKGIFKDLGISREEVSLWTVVKNYSKFLWKTNYINYPYRSAVVGLLRQALTEVCLEYLKANFFILDEFQRYRDLIKKDGESPAITLARKVFEIEGAKILMLSATPFKPYTSSLDLSSGEDHYAEFKLVLKFLMEDKDEQFWEKYEQDRKAFFHFLRRPKEAASQLSEAVKTKNRLEEIYLDVMVRTERAIVSDDHNTLLSNRLNSPFKIEIADVKDFIQTDRIARGLNKLLPHGNVYNPIEYAKSAPFPLSFMDRYKLKELLHKNKRLEKIKKILRANSDCWIDFKKVNKYKPLMKNSLPNGKLRFLLENTLYAGGSNLLWVTPTVLYYDLSGAYAGMDGFSKTLVFSSWVMVPRMIASLVSYEAERLTIGKKMSVSKQERERKISRSYFQKGKSKRRPRPQLVFTREGKSQAASNMTNFCILYPSPTLAEIYHPRQNLIDQRPISEIRHEICKKIKKLFQECDLQRFEKEDGEPSRWYWAAPLLLDKFHEDASSVVEEWICLRDLPGDSNTDPEAREDTKEEKTSESDHFYELYEAFSEPDKIGLGKMPDDLEDVMADMVLGSPAVSAFRALQEFFDQPKDIIKGATIIAKGFMTLFNKPESIATVRLFTTYKRYWQKVLDYGVSGNIQSMIDEFVFLLFECENFRQSAQELAQHFAAVMNIRTSSIRVDSLKSFLYTNENPTMRCHFALDFGNQKIETLSGKNRIINLREAFNSPFKPFILASTSIGQEGLDFHYYCRKVMHWNLPSNAIDIEQREGRINRYMGHVIRKNIAVKYLKDLSDPTKMIWKNLFVVAKEKEQANQKCDLIPYWHVECSDGIKIERIIPLHPFSKDIGKLKYLLDVLTFYRLTFGQPRQEELVEVIMQEDMDEMELNQLINNLMINLSPIGKKMEGRPLVQ